MDFLDFLHPGEFFAYCLALFATGGDEDEGNLGMAELLWVESDFVAVNVV